MITRKLLNRRREAILDIAQRQGAQDVRIFGSVAYGKADFIL